MDEITEKRAQAGQRPDLIGWKEIARALGVARSTVIEWADRGMPVINYGPTQVAAYRDRLMHWALARRRPRAA